MSVSEMARLIWGDDGRRIMVVIRGGFDSSKDCPSGVTVVAGYIADVEAWQSIEGQWNGLLALNGLREFHLREIKNRFNDWVAVARPFVTLLGKAPLRGVYALLQDDEWGQVHRGPMYEEMFPRREHACLDLFFEPLSQEMHLQFKNEPAALVFDNDWDPPQRSGESVIRIHNNWKARENHPGFNIFLKGGVPWGAIPLQAADLLAGLLRMSPFWRAALNDFASWDIKDPISQLAGDVLRTGRGTMWSKATAEKAEAALRGLRERKLAASGERSS